MYLLLAKPMNCTEVHEMKSYDFMNYAYAHELHLWCIDVWDKLTDWIGWYSLPFWPLFHVQGEAIGLGKGSPILRRAGKRQLDWEVIIECVADTLMFHRNNSWCTASIHGKANSCVYAIHFILPQKSLEQEFLFAFVETEGQHTDAVKGNIYAAVNEEAKLACQRHKVHENKHSSHRD